MGRRKRAPLRGVVPDAKPSSIATRLLVQVRPRIAKQPGSRFATTRCVMGGGFHSRASRPKLWAKARVLYRSIRCQNARGLDRQHFRWILVILQGGGTSR